MKVIVQTTINTDLPLEDILRRARERAGHFKTVPGLLKKWWVRDRKSGVYHGIFEFMDMASAEQYLATDFAASVAEAYETTEPVEARMFFVLKEQER